MIGALIDKTIGVFSPKRGLQRAQARRILQRHYYGAESHRLNNHRNPQNRSADSEMSGPWGADALRAWARMLVRDNAYAWGVVDTIVSSVVGCGIITQSMLETEEGDDAEEVNDRRDKVFAEWSDVCDINGQYDWHSLQSIVQREIVEAGECLIHMVDVPLVYRGISRPVPFALELIDADRLATDKDTLRRRTDGIKIVRGVEIDDLGKPIAYWVYPDHPSDSGSLRQEPVRIPASNMLHLFRRDRIGQTRGVSWFAPVVGWLRDMGTYLENELQASAVASCFTAAIKTNSPVGFLGTPSSDSDNTDTDGNTYDYLQPGAIMHLRPDESIEFGSPGRPNSAAEPWISLMLRGIAVGTGLSYETVARDYSKTNYSSNRASQLEDRRRFRAWQQYLEHRLCNPVWFRFCEAAAVAGLADFPTMSELLEDRHAAAPVKHQSTGWEWVDPAKEQQASQLSISSLQSTYQDELGAKGRNWRDVFRQRAREEAFRESLSLDRPITNDILRSEMKARQANWELQVKQAEADTKQAEATAMDSQPDQVAGEVEAGVSTPLTLNGAQILAAIDVLEKLNAGTLSDDAAVELLVAVGLERDDVQSMVSTQVKAEQPEPEPVVI
ncbi:MAG TPA: phage portal protein, partial [Pirellulales bacterium]|nr:phage portal protein [Pirellulales bacterium]